MAYNEINLGNQPNDGLGDGGRTGGEKINSMFREVYSHTFMKGNRWIVCRYKYDNATADLTGFRVDDRVSGWENESTKNRWVEGIVLDANISLPADIDNTSKFFIITQRSKTN